MRLSVRGHSTPLEISEWFASTIGLSCSDEAEIISETETSILLIVERLGKVSIPKRMLLNS